MVIIKLNVVLKKFFRMLPFESIPNQEVATKPQCLPSFLSSIAGALSPFSRF
jgi:hypothetical protein